MSCELDLVYDDDRWATIVSPDQDGCNDYLSTIKDSIIGAKILHVGIGNSSVYKMFQDVAGRIDGITIMDSEIEVAKDYIHLPTQYVIHKFNKYDITQFKTMWGFDFIIDNNLKQHACCQQHWEEYFTCILNKIHVSGMLITHEQGYVPHTDRITPLSTDELLQLINKQSDKKFHTRQISKLKNSYDKCPVVIKRLA
jgi:hypothetical protein